MPSMVLMRVLIDGMRQGRKTASIIFSKGRSKHELLSLGAVAQLAITRVDTMTSTLKYP